MYQRTEGDNLKYKSLLDISGYLEDNVPMSTLMKFSKEEGTDKYKVIKNKNNKIAYIWFLSLLF